MCAAPRRARACARHTDTSRPAAAVSVVDVTDMHSLLPAGAFDIIIDKGVMDAIMCAEESYRLVSSYMVGACTVLKPGGVFVVVSHGAPAARAAYFSGDGVDWTVEHREIRESGWRRARARAARCEWGLVRASQRACVRARVQQNRRLTVCGTRASTTFTCAQSPRARQAPGSTSTHVPGRWCLAAALVPPLLRARCPWPRRRRRRRGGWHRGGGQRAV